MDEEEKELERKRAQARARARARAVASRRSGTSATPDNDLGAGWNFLGGANIGIAKTLGLPVDVVNSVLSMAGAGHERPFMGSEFIRDVMERGGMAPEEATGMAGRAGEFVGAGMVPAVGIPAALSRQVGTRMLRAPSGPRTNVARREGVIPRDTGIARGVAEGATEAALRHPALYAASEAAAGSAAGAASYASEEAGAGATGRTLAEMGAGVAGGFTPYAVGRAANAAARWGIENLLAPLRSGAEMRAARAMQGQAADPDAAAAALDTDIPEGVSPARHTGDPGVMAMEQRVLDDNPALDKAYHDALLEASRRARQELSELYATPQGRQEWEHTVISSVAAPGAEVKPGATGEMLEQAYDSFDTMYGPIKEIPIHLRLMRTTRNTPLRTMLENVPKSRTVMAGDDVRDQVASWLGNQYSSISRRADNGLVSAEDMLRLRSRIRRQQRRLGRGNDPKAQAAAELLRLAEDKVTQVMRSQLAGEDLRTLRAADAQYSRYKIVEDAVRRGGDKGLTPQSLSTAVRAAFPSGEYARGVGSGMRTAARLGRPVREVMGKPDDARRMVRNATEEQRRSKHSEFVHELISRARTRDDAGENISGRNLQVLLTRNADTAKALGMTDEQVDQLRSFANQLETIQRSSPRAVNRLIEDGPSSVMELAAIMFGTGRAAQVSRATGQNMGGGIAIANYMSNKARRAMTFLTNDKAEQLIIDSFENPALMRALLTKDTDPVWKQKEAARLLEGWLVPATTESESVQEALRELRAETEGV